MLEEKIGTIQKNVSAYYTVLALSVMPLYSCVSNECKSDGDCKNGYTCKTECYDSSCPKEPPCATNIQCAQEKVYETCRSCTSTCVEKKQ